MNLQGNVLFFFGKSLSLLKILLKVVQRNA